MINLFVLTTFLSSSVSFAAVPNEAVSAEAAQTEITHKIEEAVQKSGKVLSHVEFDLTPRCKNGKIVDRKGWANLTYADGTVEQHSYRVLGGKMAPKYNKQGKKSCGYTTPGDLHLSSIQRNRWSKEYKLNLPYFLTLDGARGIGTHAGVLDNVGSGGCIRHSPQDAKKLYTEVSSATQNGKNKSAVSFDVVVHSPGYEEAYHQCLDWQKGRRKTKPAPYNPCGKDSEQTQNEEVTPDESASQTSKKQSSVAKTKPEASQTEMTQKPKKSKKTKKQKVADLKPAKIKTENTKSGWGSEFDSAPPAQPKKKRTLLQFLFGKKIK